MATTPPLGPYLQALRAGRQAEGRLQVEAARRILAALERWLADLLTAAGARGQVQRLLVQRMAVNLLTAIEEAVAAGRTLSFETQRQLLMDATQQALSSGAVARADVLLGALRIPPTTMLAAYEGIGGAANWRTVLRTVTGQAVAEANALMRQALTSGMGVDELARRMRRYVVGAEPLNDVFPEGVIDLRKIPRDLRGAARQVRHNAERIAFSETHNARHEATVQHYLHDPLVEGGQWTLSRNRGKARIPDACDVLATADFYGMGPGVYPVDKLPAPPHPWDRCWVKPVFRPYRQAHLPKSSPARQLDPMRYHPPGWQNLTPLGLQRVRESARGAMLLTPDAAA